MKNIKEQIHNHCIEQVKTVIAEIERNINDLRDAIANDTKSSMGDKYETAREMLQQDINMNMTRLNQYKQDEAVLATINVQQNSNTVIPGSIVHATNGNFYIAVSAGHVHVTIEGKKYYIISPSSPIGMQLKGKKEGDIFMLNGKSFTVNEVL